MEKFDHVEVEVMDQKLCLNQLKIFTMLDFD